MSGERREFPRGKFDLAGRRGRRVLPRIKSAFLKPDVWRELSRKRVVLDTTIKMTPTRTVLHKAKREGSVSGLSE
jgi:hypothetical protein